MRDTDLLIAMVTHAPTPADMVTQAHPAFGEVFAALYGSEPDLFVALDLDVRALVAEGYVEVYNVGPLPSDTAIRVTQAGRDRAERTRLATLSADPCPRGPVGTW